MRWPHGETSRIGLFRLAGLGRWRAGSFRSGPRWVGSFLRRSEDQGTADQGQRNQRLMVIEAIGAGYVQGVASFLSVFLVRLGSTDLMVGLLTAMPSLTGMLLAVPIGEFLSRKANIVPWYSRARFAVQACYVLTGLVPFLTGRYQIQVILTIWAVATLPQIITGVAFTALMGAVAGPRGRIALASKRWTIFAVMSTLTALLAGQILQLLGFPLNYQILFLSAALGGLVGFSQASQIKLPPVAAPARRDRLPDALRRYGSSLRANKPFTRLILSQFVFRWGLALPVPLVPIYWVRNVHASDAAISLITGVQTAVPIAAYFVWSRTARSVGSRRVLLVCTLGISFYPLLIALTPRVEPLIVWGAMAGFFAAGVDLVFFDALMDTCPAEGQTTYIGIYLMTVYIAGLAAPLVGTALSTTVGIVPALILGTVLRGAGFVLMALLGVGRPAQTAEVAAP